jgi:hypothetical protein
MKLASIHDFIVEPFNERTTSNKKIEGKDLIINTDLQSHEFVSREARVLSVPMLHETEIKEGDIVIIHHNVFRRFYDVRGKEKWSRSRLGENLWLASPDQVYGIKKENKVVPLKGYCFIAPVHNEDSYEEGKEKKLIGVIKYINPSDISEDIDFNCVAGFTPGSEFEFILNGLKLYRIKFKSITSSYGYKGKEKEYNPVWVQGG